MKLILKYDQQGNYLSGEDKVIRDDEIIPEWYTDIPLPVPNWKPLFDGEKWIETITEDEKDAIQNPPPPAKTEIEVLKEKNIELEGALLELSEISSAQEDKVTELENSLLELSQYTSTQELRNAELENALLEMSVVAANNEAKTSENEEALLETTMLVGGMTNV